MGGGPARPGSLRAARLIGIPPNEGFVVPWRRTMAEKLNLLDTFPPMTLSLAGGATLALPDAIETDYAIVLFYRGHW